MKAIIDKAIPYIQGVLEPFFDVEYLPGKDIDRAKAAVKGLKSACGYVPRLLMPTYC